MRKMVPIIVSPMKFVASRIRLWFRLWPGTKFTPKFFSHFSNSYGSQTVWATDSKFWGNVLLVNPHPARVLNLFQLHGWASYDCSKCERFSCFSSECAARWRQFWLRPIEGVQTEVVVKISDQYLERWGFRSNLIILWNGHSAKKIRARPNRQVRSFQSGVQKIYTFGKSEIGKKVSCSKLKLVVEQIIIDVSRVYST